MLHVVNGEVVCSLTRTLHRTKKVMDKVQAIGKKKCEAHIRRDAARYIYP